MKQKVHYSFHKISLVALMSEAHRLKKLTLYAYQYVQMPRMSTGCACIAVEFWGAIRIIGHDVCSVT
jgi:hypothetical protein